MAVVLAFMDRAAVLAAKRSDLAIASAEEVLFETDCNRIDADMSDLLA